MQTHWVHVIGIAGVTTSGIAVMYKNVGWKVTGSDKAFFPPVSTYLEKHGIKIDPGFKPERLTDENGNHPNIVVYQGTKSETNPELEEAKKLNLTLVNYPQVLAQDVVVNGKSIVVAGTYGKTTITSALIKIFKQANIGISYMQGGMNPDLSPTVKERAVDTVWSIIEGDEYLTSFSDKISKFFFYHPTHVILNSIKWEHPDMFASEGAYIENFAKFIKEVPASGLIVANANDKNVVEVTKGAAAKVLYYSIDESAALVQPDWHLIKESKPLPSFVRRIKPGVNLEIIPYERQIIGEFNEENLLAAAVLAYELGIRKERIQEAIREYKGVQRRLEVKYKQDGVMVIDDFGSSPPKAEGSLKALRADFPGANIVAIFEPTAGNRDTKAYPLYNKAFKDASSIILPRFSAIGKSSHSQRFNEVELAEYLKQFYQQVELIQDDVQLLERLKNIAKTSAKNQPTIILFLGSHSFRGMIDKLSLSLLA